MSNVARVQVGIIGAGPAGLLLGRLLGLAGIRFVILERQTRAHVETRIRAGVLEPGSVALLDAAGVSARLHREGLIHEGFEIARGEQRLRINLRALTGKTVMVYGQTDITRDLNAQHEGVGSQILYECEAVTPLDLTGNAARLRCRWQGQTHEFICDYLAGCDGYHGVARASVPMGLMHHLERTHPVSWLGVLADTPPVSPELLYACHPRGFALCSMRSPTRSRYYLQVPATATLDEWPDERFWDELHRRLPASVAAALVTGPAIEKSLAPLRGFVAEPLRHGRLFLAGDAAHIVPPTGAKGLNLAFGDVGALATALVAWFKTGATEGLDAYSPNRLAQVWQAQRFAWWLTALTHSLTDSAFDERMQAAEFAYLVGSASAQQSLAENYLGLPSHHAAPASAPRS